MPEPLSSREFARALSAWARSDGRGCRSGGGHAGLFNHIQFHWRPDPPGPEADITLEATSVDGRPVIRVTSSNFSSPPPRPGTRVVAPIVAHVDRTGSNGRDPDAICEACAVKGTIGRAVRTDAHGEPTEVHRFCRECWPEQSARYRARWTEENRLRQEQYLRQPGPGVSGAGPGMFFEAATWHGALDLVREIESSMRAHVPPPVEDLAQFANEIRRAAPQFDGEMPFEVEAFVQRYGAPPEAS